MNNAVLIITLCVEEANVSPRVGINTTLRITLFNIANIDGILIINDGEIKSEIRNLFYLYII